MQNYLEKMKKDEAIRNFDAVLKDNTVDKLMKYLSDELLAIKRKQPMIINKQINNMEVILYNTELVIKNF